MSGDAVIFIPGIKGTTLLETNRANWDTIWSGIQSNFESIEDLELTSAYNGQFFEENPNTIVKAGDIEALAYGEFLDDLRTDKPVYIFNYDWRLSGSINGQRLSEFMDYLMAKSKARTGNAKTIKKFDFVTHSLGNAVLRNLLHREKLKRINKIVFTVPPFKGSLDIVVTALIGEGFFRGVKAKIRKLIRTMPGALELLPSYSGASYYSARKKHDFFKFNQWQSNVRNGDATIAKKLKQALTLASKTVNNDLCDLSTLSKAERKRILILVRGGYKTWQSVPVQVESEGVESLVDFPGGLQTKDGDGRVPHVSSCLYHDSVNTLVLEDDFWFKDYDHGFFLKDERAQKLVNRFLFSRDEFQYNIPGGSVRKVESLEERKDEKQRPYWTINNHS